MKKSYYYANAQILAQREHADSEDPEVYDEYFFVHDRLGSVRMVVEYDDVTDRVAVANSYVYTPFGQFYGTPDEIVDNPWTFTGQWYDEEVEQYHLRARQYDDTDPTVYDEFFYVHDRLDSMRIMSQAFIDWKYETARA